jgi:hypothetical protein
LFGRSYVTTEKFGPVTYVTTEKFGPVTCVTTEKVGPVTYVTPEKVGPVTYVTTEKVGPVTYVTTEKFGPVTYVTTEKFGPVTYVRLRLSTGRPAYVRLRLLKAEFRTTAWSWCTHSTSGASPQSSHNYLTLVCSYPHLGQLAPAPTSASSHQLSCSCHATCVTNQTHDLINICFSAVILQ